MGKLIWIIVSLAIFYSLFCIIFATKKKDEQGNTVIDNKLIFNASLELALIYFIINIFLIIKLLN